MLRHASLNEESKVYSINKEINLTSNYFTTIVQRDPVQHVTIAPTRKSPFLQESNSTLSLTIQNRVPNGKRAPERVPEGKYSMAF